MGARRAPATGAVAPDPATEDEGYDAGSPPGRTRRWSWPSARSGAVERGWPPHRRWVQRSRRIGVGAGPIESPRLPFIWKKGLQEGLFANRESIVAPPLIVDSTAYAACLHGCARVAAFALDTVPF
jgi:hypothetical protein